MQQFLDQALNNALVLEPCLLLALEVFYAALNSQLAVLYSVQEWPFDSFHLILEILRLKITKTSYPGVR